MLNISAWLPNALAILIIISFMIIQRKLRIGSEAKIIKPSKTDQNSTYFIAITLVTSLFAIFAAVFLNINGYCIIGNTALTYIGLIFMLIGLFIRILSARTLGRFYTSTLKTIDEQVIVNKGIYKYIRHPGYLGVIVLFISGGFASGNYISLCICAGLVIPAYLYRIQTEEKMLINQFGEKYIEYKKHTSRLLPGIF